MFLIDKITLIAVWIFSLNNYLVLGFIEFNNKAIFWLLGLQSMSEFINANFDTSKSCKKENASLLFVDIVIYCSLVIHNELRDKTTVGKFKAIR